MVVCGEAEGTRYRLPRIDNRAYADAPVRAEAQLGKGKLSIHNEVQDLGGVRSKRAMITFSLPF